MRFSTVRWTTTVAAAALMALPITASAQTPAQTTPPTSQQQPTQQPPTQPPTTPPPTTSPTTQPPASQTPTTPPTASQPPAGQVDQSAAKQHLTAARESLSQLTSLPEAAKLQGDARTQVSQVISNFNELITTQANWRAAYAKLDANLTALLGADTSNPAMNPTPATAGTSGTATTGTSGTTGTTGTAGATGTTGAAPAAAGNATLDPAIRTKLVEFRDHLKEFEKAAGGATATEPAPASNDAAMPPSAATGTTTNPANPTATAANPTSPDPAKPTSGAVGTSGSVSPDPTASMTPTDRGNATAAVSNADAQKELDAIDAIIAKSKTGTLTKAQTAQLKKHVDNLRALLSR